MADVRAFVGHSFSDEDEPVVRPILEFLDSLAKSPYHSFSWEHAKEAAALSISEKVLKKFDDKTVFIGICTAREAACPKSKADADWFGNLKAPAEIHQAKSDAGSSMTVR